MCFNSRPRAEGDLEILPEKEYARFQFTPSRGGRHAHLIGVIPLNVSIHALARRATLRSPMSVHRLMRFNSRPRAEGDQTSAYRHRVVVSFNSRPRAEGDAAARQAFRLQDRFNSRPRAEGDANTTVLPVPVGRFQFTPSRGGRQHQAENTVAIDRVSIHALARRATVTPFVSVHRGKVSIHALARRATIKHLNALSRLTGFNSRPRAEGDELWERY